jgi:hypothetical protein
VNHAFLILVQQLYLKTDVTDVNTFYICKV